MHKLFAIQKISVTLSSLTIVIYEIINGEKKIIDYANIFYYI